GVVRALAAGRGPWALCGRGPGDAVAAGPGRSRLTAGGLTGEKGWSPLAGRLCATAEADGEPVLAAIHCGEAGVSVRTRADLGGGAIADMHFLETPISGTILKGAAAQRAARRGLDMGALATAAQLLGVAEGLNALTLDHLGVRRQFGRPLGSFQALQHRAVDLHMAAALGEASVEQAAEL